MTAGDVLCGFGRFVAIAVGAALLLVLAALWLTGAIFYGAIRLIAR